MKIMIIVSLLQLILIVPIDAQETTKSNPVVRDMVTFCAMGDVPYKPEEDVLLPWQIAEIPNEAEFIIHVGDIKSGSAVCDEAVYQKVSGMLRKTVAPVFIIPGDNEWNDCTNPAEAWEFWEQYFMRFDRQWNHHLPVFRQLEREENFSFVKGNVLFVGLNIVGGRIHDAAEWKKRHADNIEWVRRNLHQFGDKVSSMVIFGHAHPNVGHIDFFVPFVKEALKFKKPILYLHGDGHKWTHDRPFFPAQNVLRVQVDQGGIAAPLKVTITNHETKPFHFDRRKAQEEPAPQ